MALVGFAMNTAVAAVVPWREPIRDANSSAAHVYQWGLWFPVSAKEARVRAMNVLFRAERERSEIASRQASAWIILDEHDE